MKIQKKQDLNRKGWGLVFGYALGMIAYIKLSI